LQLQISGSFKLHENVPAYTALSVREFLVKKCIPVLLQAPYSRDLSTCDSYLFSKLDSRIKGCHFQTLDSVQTAVTNVIKTITEADFQYCSEVQKIFWVKCVASEGYYSEVANVDLEEIE
jgi:hypothetical protein